MSFMFASQIFLLALPVLAIPFLLKLIRPPKPVEVKFSQMYLLDQFLKKVNPARKKSPWLLYLIRILTLFFLVMVLAGFLIPSHVLEPNSGEIFLFDDTFYTQSRNAKGESDFNLLKSKVNAELQSLTPGSSAASIGFSGKASPWTTPGDLSTRLSQLGVGYENENWSAIRRELKLLIRTRQHETIRLKIFSSGIIEDQLGYRSMIEELPEFVQVERMDIKHNILPNMVLSTTITYRDDKIIFSGEITNATSSTQVHIESIGGEKITFAIKLDQGRGSFIQECDAKSFPAGRIYFNATDQYPFDNQHFFSSKSGGVLRVTQLTHRQAEQRLKDVGTYVDRGFTTLEKKLPLVYRVKSPRYWKSIKQDGDGVVILHDPPFLSDEEASHLQKYVQNGGALVLIPGPFTPLDLLQKRFSGFLPAELKEMQMKDIGLSDDLNWKKHCPKFMNMSFRGRWLLYRLHPQAQTWLRFSDGSPFWTSLNIGKGSIHLISSPFHMVWSDAVVSSDFPKLLKEMLKQWAPDWNTDTSRHTLTPGKSFPKHFISIRQEMGASPFQNNFATPGLYTCNTRAGKSYLLPCNFLAKIAERHKMPEEIQSDRRSNFELKNYSRADRIMVILLTLCLIAEAWLLRHHKWLKTA